MPGKKGEKMIQRLSVSKKFHSVRELVFSLFEANPVVTKEEVEKIVKKEYPKANFIGKDGRSGHFTWYRHKWNRMKLENANFTIKEAHPKEEVVNEASSDESKGNKDTASTKVDKKPVAKSSGGGKDRRIPVRKKK